MNHTVYPVYKPARICCHILIYFGILSFAILPVDSVAFFWLINIHANFKQHNCESRIKPMCLQSTSTNMYIIRIGCSELYQLILFHLHLQVHLFIGLTFWDTLLRGDIQKNCTFSGAPLVGGGRGSTLS